MVTHPAATALEKIAAEYRAAYLAHDAQRAPFAARVRYTENNIEMAFPDGTWDTVTELVGGVLTISDSLTGQVGMYLAIMQSETPGFLAVRLKVEGGRISEVEHIVSTRRNLSGPPTPIGDVREFRHDPDLERSVPPAERVSRAELVRLADGYFSTLENNTGEIRGTRFAPSAFRFENGMHFPNVEADFRLGKYRFNERVRDRDHFLVDEERGIVMSRGFIDHKGVLDHFQLTDGTPWRSIFATHSWSLLECSRSRRADRGHRGHVHRHGVLRTLSMDPAEPLKDAATSTRDWTPRSVYALGLLTLIYAFNYLDRSILSLVLPQIKAEMQLSDTVLGLVSGFAFVLFYSLLGVPIARLADRSSRRNILGAGLIFWSLMTSLTGFVVNVWQLAATRFLMGAGEACGVAPSNALVADMFSPARRALALAICPPAVPSPSWSCFRWRLDRRPPRLAHGLHRCRSASVLLALLLFATVREPARTLPAGPRGGQEGFLETARFLLRLEAHPHRRRRLHGHQSCASRVDPDVPRSGAPLQPDRSGGHRRSAARPGGAGRGALRWLAGRPAGASRCALAPGAAGNRLPPGAASRTGVPALRLDRHQPGGPWRRAVLHLHAPRAGVCRVHGRGAPADARDGGSPVPADVNLVGRVLVHSSSASSTMR
jgi:hypothetical protein